MQYPVTLACRVSFPYVWAKYFLFRYQGYTQRFRFCLRSNQFDKTLWFSSHIYSVKSVSYMDLETVLWSLFYHPRTIISLLAEFQNGAVQRLQSLLFGSVGW